MRITRRRFGGILGSAAVSCAFGAACRLESRPTQPNDGRLTAVPRTGVTSSGDLSAEARSAKAEGIHALGLERGRDAILQLPGNAASAALPLLVLLHGASGSGEGVLRRIGPAARDAGVAVLAPDSRESTWDGIRDGFGPDIAFLDRALARVFDTVSVDAARIAIGGFSDGATYALSLGLINGDLFRRVVAFSPGFLVDGPVHGKPRVFISHGTADPILPIDQCRRTIVPLLLRRGYDVTFREFAGGHTVPREIAEEAMRWIAASSATASSVDSIFSDRIVSGVRL